MSITPVRRLRQHRQERSRTLESLPGIALATDAAAVLGSIAVAAVARQFLWPPAASEPLAASVAWSAPLMGVLWLMCLMGVGAYRAAQFGAGTDEYKTVVRASIAAAALAGIGAYLGNIPLSRSFFVTVFLIGTPVLVLGRLVLRRGLHRARRTGRFTQRTLIVGAPHHVDALAQVMGREAWLGYQIVGALTPAVADEETSGGVPVLGCSDDAATISREVNADVLFVADGAFGSPARLRELAWDLEHHDVQVVIAPGVTDVSRERVRVRPVGGLPLMHLESPRAAHASRWLKRSFDLVTATLLLLALAPLMALLAARVFASDRGPVLFRQTRVGRDGSLFTCLKFRTMVADAEEHLAALKEEQGFEGGLFKMVDDPRITRPGRWMRRLSLDELPQLVNVLRGEMSLIGPRPPLPSEVAGYDDVMRRRLRVRPGLTGLWQVSGRSELTFEDAIRLDLYYVENWSMLQDLAILVRSVRAVLRSQGAY